MSLSTNFLIALLTTSFTTFFVGIFVYIKNRKGSINKAFAIYSISIAVWSFGQGLHIVVATKSMALLWGRISHVGVVLIPASFLHFVFNLLNIKGVKRKIVRFAYIISFFFLLSVPTRLYISDAVPKLSLNYFINPGVLFPFLVLFYLICIGYGLKELFREYFRSTGARRNQLKYLCWPSLFGYLGGSLNFLPVFNICIYPLNPFTTYLVPLYVVMTVYAIIKYRLLDIKVAATRAGIFAVVYTTILIVLLSVVKYAQPPFQQLLDQNWWIAILVIGMALATTGPFIYQKLRKKAEDVILKEQKQYQEALLEISHTMILIKDLDRLLKTIVLKVVDIVQVSWAAVYLKDEKAKKYILKHQRAKKGEINLPKEFPMDSALVSHLYAKKAPLTGEEMDVSVSNMGLAVPCFLDSNMVGFLLIGDKPGSSMYTQDDENVFIVLSNQTALAIENCQLYSQERLHQQYLRVSSLDRQMAGLAHEIDNPNAALLGSLGSLELALDDLKDAIPADKMEYVKKKNERARFNSKRISKMITSVREFSRPSTGEIKPIKFEWIMESFLNIIEPQFKYNGVAFTQEAPNEIIWLRANKVEIEQVLVNLGTNAVQAINEIWQKGENTPESKKEISFKAHKIDSSALRIDFSDTGGGITKEMLEDVFLDFVTTKGSREGTGLGLSISRKIIQKHNGKIWAESEGENKGATFHIELPIASDISEEEKQQAEIERGGAGKKDMFIQDFPK